MSKERVRLRSFGNMSQGPYDKGKVKIETRSEPKFKSEARRLARVLIVLLESWR